MQHQAMRVGQRRVEVPPADGSAPQTQPLGVVRAACNANRRSRHDLGCIAQRGSTRVIVGRDSLAFVSLCDWHSGVALTTSGVRVCARLTDAHCRSG
jgi:hypothetical protein